MMHAQQKKPPEGLVIHWRCCAMRLCSLRA